jgi:hypothetical protein
MAHRHRRHRPPTEVLEKAKAGIYSQFEVQRGRRSPSWSSISPSSAVVGESHRVARHGAIPAVQPCCTTYPPRHLRRRILPQRADLISISRPRSACSAPSRGSPRPTLSGSARPRSYSVSPTASSRFTPGADSARRTRSQPSASSRVAVMLTAPYVDLVRREPAFRAGQCCPSAERAW